MHHAISNQEGRDDFQNRLQRAEAATLVCKERVEAKLLKTFILKSSKPIIDRTNIGDEPFF